MVKIALAAALLAGTLHASAAGAKRDPETRHQALFPKACWILPTVGCH